MTNSRPPVPEQPRFEERYPAPVRMHPLWWVVIALAGLFAVVAGPYIVFIGTLWVACRGGSSC
jgi:hypothetical protein